ncbi:sensor histidine kinase [Nonomuraea sp. NPDC059194]|uniref:sensor histidine kinase n=1 Tax=Nonomuraea sp. NPDC059194 TaxID=3346764 RepID=UPI0036920C30
MQLSRLRPRSIRARMTAATVVGFGVILLIGVVTLCLTVPGWVHDQLVNRAAQASRHLTLLVDDQPVRGPIPPQHGVSLLQVVDARGRVVAAGAALEGRPPLTTVRPDGGDPRVQTRVCGTGGDGCLIVVGTANRTTPYGPVIAYAAVGESILMNVPLLAAVLSLVSAVLTALLGWATWIGVGRVLAPVERIRSGLEQISATELSDRMPVPDTGDEVAGLAITVNDTLARLEDAVDRHRRFVSDASHELRTPLTAMMVRLEGRSEGEDCELIMGEVLGDAQRLSAIVQDLLLMARLDAGVRAPYELLDLGKLVADEVGRRPSRLPFTTSIEPGLMVRGNRLRLDRLLTNLLSNADRYGENAVHVTVARDGPDAVVEVADDGPGIPADQREAVFRRFTRLDTARSRDIGGTGLGLPIARDIATAHGGTLQVADSRDRGARLVLRLPLR